jgi:hypothetical protein
MQEVSGSIPLGSTIPRTKRVSGGKLVGEVSPTGFFRVEVTTGCLKHFLTG